MLTPEELYKRSEEQRKQVPEQERAELFYIELDSEVTANLIEEDSTTQATVLLRAIKQGYAGEEEHAILAEDTKTNTAPNQPSLWDI